MDFFFSRWLGSILRLHWRWQHTPRSRHGDGLAHYLALMGAWRGGEKTSNWNRLGCFYSSGRSFCCCQAAWLRAEASPDASSGSRTSLSAPRSSLSLSSRVAGAPATGSRVIGRGLSARLPRSTLALERTCRDSSKNAKRWAG